MLEESPGSFAHFADLPAEKVHRQLQNVYIDLQLARVHLAIYPRLQELPLTSCTICTHESQSPGVST
ncbi:MAG TPA: hypothetical protein VGF67_34085 [Ktedonobacteraceae bacterium]|jgi:hypothetical protein